MNPFEKIPENEIHYFKEKVKHWLPVAQQIAELEGQIRNLKKVRNKELEPEITTFMTKYNVTDLNTDNGKLRCQERKTKKGLNKNNIRENLSKYLKEEDKLDQALDDLWTNREIKISYKLRRMKDKK
jgi:DNA repair exonuclease SbcCD ATPase subunit